VKRESSQREKVMRIRRMLRYQTDKQKIPNEVIIPTPWLLYVHLSAGIDGGSGK
jgi:hypothetical protein